MRFLTIILASQLMACGVASTYSADTTTILASKDESGDLHAQLQEACENLPAHVTRSQLGNRPIVINGVTFYCF